MKEKNIQNFEIFLLNNFLFTFFVKAANFFKLKKGKKKMIFLIHFLVLSLSEEADNYNSTNSTNTTNETTYLKVGDKCNEESLIEDGLICCNSIVFDQNDVNESCLPPNKVGMYSGKQTIMHFIFHYIILP